MKLIFCLLSAPKAVLKTGRRDDDENFCSPALLQESVYCLSYKPGVPVSPVRSVG
jgi:hypothetical protein